MVSFSPTRIHKLREALELTQEAFARELGVSFTTVSRWENGHGTPSPLAKRRLEELRRARSRHKQTDSRRRVQ